MSSGEARTSMYMTMTHSSTGMAALETLPQEAIHYLNKAIAELHHQCPM